MNSAQQASHTRRWNSRASFSLTRSRTVCRDYVSGIMIIEGIWYSVKNWPLYIYPIYPIIIQRFVTRNVYFINYSRDWPWSSNINTGLSVKSVEDWWKILEHLPWNSLNLKNIPEHVSSSYRIPSFRDFHDVRMFRIRRDTVIFRASWDLISLLPAEED